MPIFRIEKISNYSTISNDLIRDKKLSLTSRGLLVFMLSLPNDWDFSCKGLIEVTNTKEATLRTCLKELENANYLIREPIRENGKIRDWVYWIYEKPFVEFQQVEKPQVEFLLVENHAQLNKDITNNLNKQNTKEKEINKEKWKYFDSPELEEAFTDYVAMRKKIKAPMTDKAIKLAIDKLFKLSKGNEQVMVEILNQSVMNSWKGLFELKGATEQTSNSQKKIDYLREKYHD